MSVTKRILPRETAEAITGQVLTGIEAHINQAVGAASMCWDKPEAAGVFRTEQALAVSASLHHALERVLVDRLLDLWTRGSGSTSILEPGAVQDDPPATVLGLARGFGPGGAPESVRLLIPPDDPGEKWVPIRLNSCLGPGEAERIRRWLLRMDRILENSATRLTGEEDPT